MFARRLVLLGMSSFAACADSSPSPSAAVACVVVRPWGTTLWFVSTEANCRRTPPKEQVWWWPTVSSPNEDGMARLDSAGRFVAADGGTAPAGGFLEYQAQEDITAAGLGPALRGTARFDLSANGHRARGTVPVVWVNGGD